MTADELQRPTTRRRAASSADTRDPAERLGELFDAHHRRLLALARRMGAGAEEARDLVQEAFLRAARRPARLPGGDQGAEAWLVRVLVNLVRDRRRRHAVRRREAPHLEPRKTDPASSAEERTAARSAVRSALATLPPRRRAVVVLHELEDRPVAEIARLLGIARVTVRWHLSTGRRELADRLLEEAEGTPKEGGRR